MGMMPDYSKCYLRIDFNYSTNGLATLAFLHHFGKNATARIRRNLTILAFLLCVISASSIGQKTLHTITKIRPSKRPPFKVFYLFGFPTSFTFTFPSSPSVANKCKTIPRYLLFSRSALFMISSSFLEFRSGTVMFKLVPFPKE